MPGIVCRHFCRCTFLRGVGAWSDYCLEILIHQSLGVFSLQALLMLIMRLLGALLYTATVSSVLTVDLDAEDIIGRVMSVKGEGQNWIVTPPVTRKILTQCKK